MSWRGTALPLILAGLLSGCVSDKAGLDFASVAQKVGPPKPGQSRVVVLQEKPSGLVEYCACDMKLDGAPIGMSKAGTYIYADRPAGRHTLTATELLFPGETTREVTTAPGRTYFFLAKSGQRHNTVNNITLIGGLAGAAIASVATAGSENPGPVDLFPLDEGAARTILAGLQLSE